MTKDLLIAYLHNYLKENIYSLSNEDRFLIHILSTHLLTLILPDRNQNISEQLPEIISNAINTYMAAEDPEGVTLRGEYKQKLGREISIEEDRDKIVLLLEKITESKALTV